MNEKPLLLKILLWPISLLYKGVVTLRNIFFDCGILPSKAFDVPIISVGNLTVGGTGKTPFSEFLIRHLIKEHKVGFLSRGYKRDSKGFQIVTTESGAKKAGDEPYQVKQKFPEVMVAVDADRRRGISKMMKEPKEAPSIIILDDAFQHRYVKPDISILLIDYNRMVTEDKMLPLGNLREPVSSLVRADIIIVTKCPADTPSIEFRIIKKNLKPYPYQELFFTTQEYDEPVSLFPDVALKCTADADTTVLTLTGIASPHTFEEHVKNFSKEIVTLNFSDHHNFKKSDLSKVETKFNDIENEKKIILTTEKDAVRLKSLDFFPDALKPYIFYIPLHIVFLQDEKKFYKNIKDHLFNKKFNSQFSNKTLKR
jgi:tetraacyldisaccharide 4'-kinase